MTSAESTSLQGKELSLIYIAGSTSEAKNVEKILTDEEIEYELRATPFLHSTFIGETMELPGVGFYVLSAQAQYCRKMLDSRNFKVGLILDGEE